jgi:flagellar biosynthetic protein FliP
MLAVIVIFTVLILAFINTKPVFAAAAANGNTPAIEETQSPNNVNGAIGPLEFSLNTDEDENGLASTMQILMVLTVISLAPSILIMVTSFTRIIIVLHFVRSALGTQTTPPNQVIVGLALFITIFIMSPVMTKINTEAIKPLTAGEITQEEAWNAGISPIRTFMLEQMDDAKDLKLFLDIAGISEVKTPEDIPITVVIPAFIISELRKAFIIGFLMANRC